MRKTLKDGYKAWINKSSRVASSRTDFGAWWRLDESLWRVSWLEDTGELYANELGAADRYILLGKFKKKEITDLMRQWFDGNNLRVLIERFASGKSDPSSS